MEKNMDKAIVTGAAGFIGFHLSKYLLERGYQVLGVDALTDYYDVKLKEKRLSILKEFNNFSFSKEKIENKSKVSQTICDYNPNVIIHLAAQAGVRYSLENPQAYLDSNITGTFNILEAAKRIKCNHLLMASTSSVYGANEIMPFDETQKADTPLTFYAATKKANEVMAHSYAHLWKIPITMLRFFTVYGPWGRPDLALFKFTKAMLNNEPIDIYNHGNMFRDFTYVDDLVHSIFLLIKSAPKESLLKTDVIQEPLSEVAPFQILNIGNSNKTKLMDFVEAIEKKLNIKANKNFLPMQKGDVPATWADCNRLQELIGFKPNTTVEQGISEFVDWYLEYYNQQ